MAHPLLELVAVAVAAQMVLLVVQVVMAAAALVWHHHHRLLVITEMKIRAVVAAATKYGQQLAVVAVKAL
jgi:cell division protein FtsL